MTYYTKEFIKNSLANNRHVILEITDKCNFECEYCAYGKYYNHNREKSINDQDFKIVKHLFDFLIKYWNSEKNLSYETDIWISFFGGEPLLNFDFIEDAVFYLEKSEIKFNNVKFNITTNGYFLDKYISFLKDHDFQILVSLDGNIENNRYRKLKNGKPSFDKVINNLKDIQSRYPLFFEKRISFHSVLHNLNTIDGIYSFFECEFKKKPSVSEMLSEGIKEKMKASFSELYCSLNSKLKSLSISDYTDDLLFKTKNGHDLLEFLYFNTENFYKEIDDLLYEKKNIKKIPTGSCIPLQKSILLNSKYEIFPCTSVGVDQKMGEIKKKKVEIWFDKIVSKYNSTFNKLESQCKTCYNINNCPNCILISDLTKNMNCPFWIGETDYNKKRKDILEFISNNKNLYQKISEEIFLE